MEENKETEKEKKRNYRARKYQLTINNPDKHENCSHEDIKRTLSRWKNIKYWCMCDELGGEEHTLHTHIYEASGIMVEA